MASDMPYCATAAGGVERPAVNARKTAGVARVALRAHGDRRTSALRRSAGAGRRMAGQCTRITENDRRCQRVAAWRRAAQCAGPSGRSARACVGCARFWRVWWEGAPPPAGMAGSRIRRGGKGPAGTGGRTGRESAAGLPAGSRAAGHLRPGRRGRECDLLHEPRYRHPASRDRIRCEPGDDRSCGRPCGRVHGNLSPRQRARCNPAGGSAWRQPIAATPGACRVTRRADAKGEMPRAIRSAVGYVVCGRAMVGPL